MSEQPTTSPPARQQPRDPDVARRDIERQLALSTLVEVRESRGGGEDRGGHIREIGWPRRGDSAGEIWRLLAEKPESEIDEVISSAPDEIRAEIQAVWKTLRERVRSAPRKDSSPDAPRRDSSPDAPRRDSSPSAPRESAKKAEDSDTRPCAAAAAAATTTDGDASAGEEKEPRESAETPRHRQECRVEGVGVEERNPGGEGPSPGRSLEAPKPPSNLLSEEGYRRMSFIEFESVWRQYARVCETLPMLGAGNWVE